MRPVPRRSRCKLWLNHLSAARIPDIQSTPFNPQLLLLNCRLPKFGWQLYGIALPDLAKNKSPRGLEHLASSCLAKSRIHFSAIQKEWESFRTIIEGVYFKCC